MSVLEIKPVEARGPMPVQPRLRGDHSGDRMSAAKPNILAAAQQARFPARV